MLIINFELGAMADTTGKSITTDVRAGSSSFIWVHGENSAVAIYEAHEHDEIHRMFAEIAYAALQGRPAFDVLDAESSWHVDNEEQ